MHERVEVCEVPKARLVGLSEHARPDGITDEPKVTVPVKPLTGATVVVDWADDPALAEVVVGLAVTV